MPVVVLEGARATGKTSVGAILREKEQLAAIADLGDPTVLAAARASPTAFVDSLAVPALIDEAQLVPELTVAVKRRVDWERGAGLFVLTGSSRLGRAELGGSDPLAGRSIRLRLGPMTQGELAGTPVNVVPALLEGRPPSAPAAAITRAELIARVRRGGLPALADVVAPVPELLRPQLYAEYVEGVVHHDVGRRVDRAETIRLLRYLAASTARLLNVSNVANELATTRETVAARLAVLDAAFLMHQLPAHRPSEHRTLTAHPKVHAGDVGLAAWASRLDDDPPPALFESLVETLVVNELVAQAAWVAPGVAVRHWRDTARKAEVDAVLVDAAGASVAVEVKASTDVRPEDIRGLRSYLASVDQARLGVVFYTGELTLPLAERIWAVPITALWEPPR